MTDFRINELKEIIRLAEHGDAESQYILGAKLFMGDLLDEDHIGGVFWYLESARQGYVYAIWNLGVMLVEGDEDCLPKNRALGFRLVKIAADAGNLDACDFLANCYEFGKHGVEIDQAIASQWRTSAQWQSVEDSKLQDFDEPVDITEELSMVFKRPTIKIKNRGQIY